MKHWIRFICLSLLSIVAGMASAQNVAKIGGTEYATLQAAFNAATDGQTVEITEAGSYSLPGIPNNITIQGNVDGVEFNHTGSGNVANVPKGATFKNVTFNFGNENYHGFQHAGTINMDGCTLNGKFFSYGDMNFTNCTFEQTNSDYHMWVYGPSTVKYTCCTFNGKGKFLNVYREGPEENNVIVDQCTFNSDTKNKAAINVKATNGTKLLKANVTITNCTTNENFPEASSSDALVVLNNLVQVDDRTADGVDNITVTLDGNKIYPVNYVAQIGETKYETLEAAFAAVLDGETITLLDDVSLAEKLIVALEGKTVTLDLGKKTLTGRTNLISGNLTVTNGTIVGGSQQALNVYGSATNAENYSVLTIANDVTVTADVYGVSLFGATAGSNGYGAVVNIAGTVTTTGDNKNGAVFVSGNLGKNIADDMNNVINVTGSITSATDAAIALVGNATVNVESGAVITGNTGIAIKRGVLNVEDGATVHATGAENLNPDPNNNGTEMTGAAISMTDTYNNYGAMAVNITGGTFTSDNTVALFKEDGTYTNAATYSVSGGTFSSAVPAEFCAEGYIPADLGDGKFSVKVGSYVAQIGNSKFETLQAAVDAAEANATIEILKDFTLTTVTTSPSNKYNVNVNKSVTINGNGHVLTSAEGKRAIVLQGAGNNVTLKDITVKSNKAEACLWIADAVNVTLDNSTLDGTNGKSYNQPLTIGQFESESRVILNIINGSVIKTNDAGTAHYDIIAWHPADITVTNSKLIGWAGVYLKPDAAGSTVKIDGSEMKSTGIKGDSNNFAAIVTESGNNEIEVKDTKISTTPAENTNQSLFVLGGEGNVVKFLGSSTYETTDMTYGPVTHEPGSLVNNKVYFDDATKAAFAKYFTAADGPIISDEKESPVDLYPLVYTPEVYYYWFADGKEEGGYYHFAEPFTNGWLADGEFIQLMKDVSLTEDVACQLESGASFTLTLGDYKVTKGNFSVSLKPGVTVYTDKSASIFSAAEEGYVVKSTKTDNGYTYTVEEADLMFADANGKVSYKAFSSSVISANGSYKLLKDVTATARIAPTIMPTNIIVDLNGHTLTSTATDYGFLLSRAGTEAKPKTFELVDNSEEKGGKLIVNAEANAAIQVQGKYNEVTIGEGVTVENGCVAILSENDKLTVAGTIIGGDDFAVATNGTTTKNANITIKEGAVLTSNETAMYLPGNEGLVATVEGGSITGAKTGIEVRAGQLTVNGGTISTTAEEYSYTPNGNGTTTKGAAIAVVQHTTVLPTDVQVLGGTLEGTKTIAVVDAQSNNLKDITVSVADGLTEKAYIPEGFKWVSADGMSTLTKKEYVAQVGDVKYETLKEALDAAKDNENIVVELLADATLDITAWDGEKNALSIGSANTKTITINGNSHQLVFNNKNSDWNNIATMNDAETKLILNDMAITNSGHNDGPWNRHDINFNCAVELNNVTSDKALAFKNDATLKNVTVTETGDVYAIWVQPHGQNISIEGLTINAANGRGIKIDDKYVDNPEKVTLDIANATFNTTKKAGVLVKSKGGAEITVGEGINIDNVAADKENLVWVDEDSAEEFYKVTVNGATVVPESKESDYVASLMNGEQRWGFYKELSKAVNNVEEGFSIKLHKTTTEAVEVSKALTITKNGFTADNVTAGEGFKKFETETEIVIKSFNPVCAIDNETYESLQEAVNAAGTNAATITLLTEAATDGVISGNGVKVPSGSNITFDLNGLTYNASGETVGSSTYETQGFQLLMNSNITFKNGTLKATSPTAQMLIQNYANLTLEDVNLDGTGLSGWAYALSNNCGTINLTGSTSITAKEGGRAFDTCKFGDYAIPTVNINTTGVISGPIEATGGKLNIENGKFDVTWVTDSHYAVGDIQIKGGEFTAEVPEEYCAEGYVCTENTDATYKYTVKTKEEAGIYELIDGTPYPESLRANGGYATEVTYTRSFPKKDAYSAWWVPFDYTVTDDDAAKFDFYTIHMIAGSNKEGGEFEDTGKIWIYITKQSSGKLLKGDHLYVIKPKEVIDNYVFKAENVELLPQETEEISKKHTETSQYAYDFYGTYVGTEAQKVHDFMALTPSGQIAWNAKAGLKLGSYRWYIRVAPKGSDDDADAKITIGFVEDDGNADGINNAQTAESEIQGIYTLGGIKVEHPVKGVNIIKYTDGRTKKIYVK